MNWSMWSSIAEIVSSVAILVTLIYVAIEVRQNTAATQASTREAVLHGELEVLALTAADPGIISLLYKTDSLTDLEANKLHTWLLMFARLREANYRQHETSVLDTETWNNLRSSITSGPLATPNGRRWWINVGQNWFNKGFSEEISRRLAHSQDVVTAQVFFARPPSDTV